MKEKTLKIDQFFTIIPFICYHKRQLSVEKVSSKLRKLQIWSLRVELTLFDHFAFIMNESCKI